ncbi:MAG: diaminopimelate epimerase [bacterium]
MKIPFVKMSGAGNDMILVDHRERVLAGREAAFARHACHRRFGIGADALILLEEAENAAFSVRFFNPDGGEYALCGNGARCVPLFAAELGIRGPRYEFTSASGRHVGEMLAGGVGRIELPPVREIRLDVAADLEGRAVTLDWGDIGVPHAALWVDDVDAVPLERWAPHLRHHAAFGPSGTNVSFVQRVDGERVRIRTFERGVEGETWACGSGSAVVATILRRRRWTGPTVHLAVRGGGELIVRVPDDPTAPILLEGPVARCFEGVVEVPDEGPPDPVRP